MIKKRLAAGIAAAAMSCMMVSVCVAEESTLSAAEIVEDIVTAQAFTDEAVSAEDIDAIVMAGVNAPSAINTQPWHFTVVTNPDTIQELANAGSAGTASTDAESADGESAAAETADGESAAVESDGESADGESADGESAAAENTASAAKAGLGDAPLVIVISAKDGSDLDAGLATQNMSAEAQILGLGTKILTSPTLTLNSDDMKSLLGVPEGMSVVSVLLVGYVDTEAYDAVSGATTRNAVEDVVTYLK